MAAVNEQRFANSPALRVPDLTWLATDDLHTHGERLNDSNVLDPRACEVQRKAVDNSAVAFLYKPFGDVLLFAPTRRL